MLILDKWKCLKSTLMRAISFWHCEV